MHNYGTQFLLVIFLYNYREPQNMCKHLKSKSNRNLRMVLDFYNIEHSNPQPMEKEQKEKVEDEFPFLAFPKEIAESEYCFYNVSDPK